MLKNVLICFNKGNSNNIMYLENKYWMHKTTKGREDVYFNGEKTEGRMGGLYNIKIVIYDGDENIDSENPIPLLEYYYDHLVVDDYSSHCIPFIESGTNWCVVSSVYSFLYIPNFNNSLKICTPPRQKNV